MATPFQIRADGNFWLVLVDSKCIECASENNAKILSQIPVLEDRLSANAPEGATLDLLRQVVELGKDHHFRGEALTLKMMSPRFRHLMSCLDKAPPR